MTPFPLRGTAARDVTLQKSDAVDWLRKRHFEVLEADSLSPSLRLVTDEFDAPGFRLARLWHTPLEARIHRPPSKRAALILLPVEGDAVLSGPSLDRPEPVLPGDVVVLPGGTECAWAARTPSARYEVELGYAALSAIDEEAATRGRVLRGPAHAYRSMVIAAANAALNSSMTPADSGFPSFRAAIRNLLTATLLEALSAPVTQLSRGQQLFREAQGIIADRATDPDFTVARLCEALSVSLRRLQAAFAESGGNTPASEIRTARIDMARSHLDGRPELTPAGAEAVARLSGFPSARAMRRALALDTDTASTRKAL